MIYASKGNRVRQIAEPDIDRFVEKGYTIIDEKGTVIKETIPTDMATLKLAYINHIEEIANLKAEIEQLKSVKAEATTKKSTKKVSEDKVAE